MYCQECDEFCFLQTWRLPSLVQHLTLTGHKRGIWSAVFSKLEQVVATGSGDKTIKLWSLSTGACLRTFQGHTSSVLKLYYLPSGLQVSSFAFISLQILWPKRQYSISALAVSWEQNVTFQLGRV